MKKTILIILLLITGPMSFSQGADAGINYVDYLDKNIVDVGENQTSFQSLAEIESCASSGDANCLNILGLLYKQGLGVQNSEEKTFELVMQAAKKGFPAAEYNIGRFYMTGLGCDIDFDKAKSWLTIAADHGNQRAAYALGYMYFKGFGFAQDYKTAVSWFELSPWPMAKHHLGICYYFGYGVEKDEDKAILYFSQSQTTNSNMFLKHIAENVKETVDASLVKQINETETTTNSAIVKEAIDKTTEKLEDTKPTSKKELKPKYFNGKWKGKLVELDWSKKEITRILPLTCEFTAEDDNVHYKWNLNNQTSESTAILEDNALYFDKLNLAFDMPYSENPNSNILVSQLLSSQMEFKTVNKKVYLTGSLQTFTPEWQEPGPPMHIILKQTEEGVDEDLTAEELLALSDQEEHFITLYPNPFVNDVLIEYELENDANVNVGVYDFSGNNTAITLEKDVLQNQGRHKYTFNGSNLLPGLYVVRVGVNNELHSRILIKK